MDPLGYFTFQPVTRTSCSKGHNIRRWTRQGVFHFSHNSPTGVKKNIKKLSSNL